MFVPINIKSADFNNITELHSCEDRDRGEGISALRSCLNRLVFFLDPLELVTILGSETSSTAVHRYSAPTPPLHMAPRITQF